MTVHAAAVYFDDSAKCCGLLLGADRIAVRNGFYTELGLPVQQDTSAIFYQPKGFIGSKNIGFCSGVFEGRRESLETDVRSLDYLFDDFPASKQYREHHFLKNARSYSLSVAVCQSEEIRLFEVIPEVSGEGTNPEHLVCKITPLTYDTLKNTVYWTKLNGKEKKYGRRDHTRRLGIQHAKILLEHHMREQLQPLEVEDTSFDFYAIDKLGIQIL